ncbi:hypothetical protein PGTUg99_009112 [Puccinia graminis f. sp. tritici]|uniref:Uncharacterized protein n=1 Tax=Puccinia graminis f. sp. tritici TaxID=56615 RepID=A0A5B0PPF9_PUCGR|nr:hypothetical protein PGTUg99_009112 [Puccinia graminis f. sp. tritici]
MDIGAGSVRASLLSNTAQAAAQLVLSTYMFGARRGAPRKSRRPQRVSQDFRVWVLLSQCRREGGKGKEEPNLRPGEDKTLPGANKTPPEGVEQPPDLSLR